MTIKALIACYVLGLLIAATYHATTGEILLSPTNQECGGRE